MNILLDPNIAYLLLAGGLICAVLSLLSPGTGVLEALALVTLVLAGVSMITMTLGYILMGSRSTYLRAGLPPGPICNPGRRALEAALSPERNNYLFFVARGDGTHAFSRTAAEHAANCRTLLGN